MVMVKVEGSGTVRKGSQKYKRWQLLEADGETAVDLSAATKVTMRLKEEQSGDVTEFATDDGSPILFIISPATSGYVELRPLADTFDEVTKYIFHFIVTDAVGNEPIPEGWDERLTVIDNYPPPP